MGEKWKLSHERPEFQGMFFGGILVPAQFCGGFFDKPLTFSDPVFLTTRMTHGSCHKVFFSCFSMACLGGFQQGYRIRSDGMGPQAARLDYCTSTKVGGPKCLETYLANGQTA